MEVIKDGEWSGLSQGSKDIIRDKVVRAAKIKVEEIFGDDHDGVLLAAKRFEEALIRVKGGKL